MGKRSWRLLLLCFPSALQMENPTQMETGDPKALSCIKTTAVHVLHKKIREAKP